jgi:hypothetical protein
VFSSILTSRTLQLLLCSGLGLGVNLSLGMAGQQWARLKSQRYSALVLPPAGAIITWTISSNLALSLGMIGALSIVRFRTPVKNPFELVVFFCYLIFGISCGINPKFAIVLALIVGGGPYAVQSLDYILNLFGNRISGTLTSKSEFSSAPFQLVAQYRSNEIRLPENIDLRKVVSLSSQPATDEDDYLLDISVAFDNQEEALRCMKSLQNDKLVFASVHALDR